MEFLSKKTFLKSHNAKLAELEIRQHEYKRLVNTTIPTRKQAVIAAKYKSLVKNLRKEKNELRTLNWVAERGCNRGIDQRILNDIECHIDCQEHLSAYIKKLKKDIANMERAKRRATKEIAVLNKKTISDGQSEEYYKRTTKVTECLDNELEMCKHRECALRSENADCRHEIVIMLKDRDVFNETYSKLIQRLSRDKKYMADLIEYVMHTLDKIIDIYDKMENFYKKNVRDKDKFKVEMEDILFKIEGVGDLKDFLDVKANRRELADVAPKECKRREDFLRKYNHKVNLYGTVLEKISNYTGSTDVKAIISRFKIQENLYYSYFDYANELSYHITSLDHAVSELYADITDLKEDRKNVLIDQLTTIDELEKSLKNIQKRNIRLASRSKSQESDFQDLLTGIEDIFELVRADATPLLILLGDHSQVHLGNVPRVLRLLERRILNVTASVYVLERLDESKMINEYIVEQVHKLCEWPTALDDIVLTTMCPECAESEIVNVDEGGDAIHPLSTQEARMKLYEKVTQPEMQYRLHSLEECRLPQSRLLAAKNNA